MKHNTQPKRILIVDDEPDVAIALVENLEALGDEYSIKTANSGDEALAMIRENSYVLVLTDYKMPDMDGLKLAQAVRQFSPETQVVLMTAYGTKNLRDAVEVMELGGYIDKPFTMAQIQEIVKRAIGLISDEDPYRSGDRILEQPVHEHLKELQVKTGAACVLLLSLGGYPVETGGVTKGLDIAGVSALVAANFAASAELARLLKSSSIFKSSYHEGPEYNIYAYDVNGELLLVVIFSSKTKPGAVWFYTKQTASELAPLLVTERSSITQFGEDLVEAMDAEIEQLLVTGDDRDVDEDQVLTFQEAISAGLVPPDIGGGEADQQQTDELDIEDWTTDVPPEILTGEVNIPGLDED